MQNVNVVCVNWGDKYTPEYVMRLYEMVAATQQKNSNFIVSLTGSMPTKCQ